MEGAAPTTAKTDEHERDETMSEQVIWSQLSEREKGALILEYVLGYYILPDGTHKDGELIKRGLGAPAGYHHPTAFWDDFLGCYQIQDAKDPYPFDPLRNLNDTWGIIEELNLPFHLIYLGDDSDTPEFDKAYTMAFDDGKTLEAAGSKDVCEAICQAALRMKGVVIAR